MAGPSCRCFRRRSPPVGWRAGLSSACGCDCAGAPGSRSGNRRMRRSGRLGDAPRLVQHQAGDGDGDVLGQAPAELAVEVADRHVAVDGIAAVGSRLTRRRLRDVVLVLDVADDLLDDVLERHDAAAARRIRRRRGRNARGGRGRPGAGRSVVEFGMNQGGVATPRGRPRRACRRSPGPRGTGPWHGARRRCCRARRDRAGGACTGSPASARRSSPSAGRRRSVDNVAAMDHDVAHRDSRRDRASSAAWRPIACSWPRDLGVEVDGAAQTRLSADSAPRSAVTRTPNSPQEEARDQARCTTRIPGSPGSPRPIAGASASATRSAC